jgi:hypothetical protein
MTRRSPGRRAEAPPGLSIRAQRSSSSSERLAFPRRVVAVVVLVALAWPVSLPGRQLVALPVELAPAVTAALPASRGRRRDYAGEYRRRVAAARARGYASLYRQRVASGVERGYSARQAVGHAGRGERGLGVLSAARSSEFPMFATGGRFLADVPVTRAEARRLGRYFALLRSYERGEVGTAEFRRRVSRWRPVAGHRLEADPDTALAMAARMSPGDWRFDYRHGRAGRAT